MFQYHINGTVETISELYRRYLNDSYRDGIIGCYRYTNMELTDRFALMNVAFAQKPYKTDENLNIIDI